MSEELLHQILSKLDGMDQRLDRVEDKFGSMEVSINALESRMNRFEEEVYLRFDRVDEHLVRVDQRLDEMNHKIDSYHAENIQADELILSKISTLEQSTNDRFAQHEQFIHALNKRVFRLEADVESR